MTDEQRDKVIKELKREVEYWAPEWIDDNDYWDVLIDIILDEVEE